MAGHQAQADCDLVQDGLAFVLGWGRRLARADRAQQHGRDEVGDGVNGNGQRAADELDEEAGRAEGQEFRHRARRRQRPVRTQQVAPGNDGRQVGPVGRVEESGQHRRQQRDDEQLRQRQPAADGRQGDGSQQEGPPEIGPDHHRTATQAINPGAGDKAHDEDGDEVCAAHEGDVEGVRRQHQDGHERQRHAREQAAEDRDRGRGPDTCEGAVAPQRAPGRGFGRRQVWVGQRLGGHPRRVGQGRPPARTLWHARRTRLGHPCSTISPTDSAMRSAS